MKDYRASIDKLRRDAAEAALIRDLATDKTKREMYQRLHEHLLRLANEVERAMHKSEDAEPLNGSGQATILVSAQTEQAQK